MNYRLPIAAAAIGLCALVGCRQHDYRTIVIRVPDMKNAACVRIVTSALSRLPGLKPDSLSCSVDDRTVTLTYDTLLAADKNAEFLVARAGFRVIVESLGSTVEIPADPAALDKLPPECRP